MAESRAGDHGFAARSAPPRASAAGPGASRAPSKAAVVT